MLVCRYQSLHSEGYAAIEAIACLETSGGTVEAKEMAQVWRGEICFPSFLFRM